MTQIATVERILDAGNAEISVARQSACGHDCASCGGCGVMSGQVIYTRAKNPLGAEPGQRVVVQSASAGLLSAAAMVYLLPIAAFFAGYLIFAAFTGNTAAQYAGGALGLIAGLIPAVFYDREIRARGGLDFTIVRLL